MLSQGRGLSFNTTGTNLYPNMRIVTPGSVLRTWTPDDAGSLVRHANNPRIAAVMRDGFPSPYTPADACRFIETAMDTTSHLYLAIDVRGEAVGGIGIQPLADIKRRTAEIGYWLSESFWGRGIVTGAVRSLVPVAFERFEIVRLEAGVFSTNPASMRVLEKCGFTREAVHRMAVTKNGATLDEVVYVRFAGDAG
ncbi:Acetyltransferase (GNAT) domain protein [anaerobic digester metagenome]